MREPRDAILIRLEQLSRTVEDLERRLTALEGGSLPAGTSAALASETESAAAVAGDAAGLAEPAPNLVPLFGWALMGIAGAYLLRALAEAGGMRGTVAACAGILYAAWWLLLASRRASEKPVYSAVHGLTASLILAPMLWEMTVRFHLLSAQTASAIVVGFAVLGLAIGWRKNVSAIAWTVAPAALLTACALFRETHDATLWTITVLAVAVAVEASACRDHWLGLRWIAAVAADLAVLVLTDLALRRPGATDALVAVHPGAALGAQIALLTIYLASTVDRTIFRGLNITYFEIGQAAVACAVALGGALRVAGAAPAGTMSVGLFCLIGGAACYLVSFAFLDRIHKRDRNFFTYSTFGLLLIPTGCAVLLKGSPLAAAWSALAVLMMLAGLHGGRDTLRVHGAIYLILAVLHTRLPQLAVAMVIHTTAEPVAVPAGYGLVLAGAAACYAVMVRAGRQDTWIDAAEALVMAALLVLGTAGLLAAAIWSLISPAAPLRTALLTAAAMGAAWAGARWRRQELARLAYPLLALAGIKLITEDLQQGQSLLLFLSLVLCGGALVLLPRLSRR